MELAGNEPSCNALNDEMSRRYRRKEAEISYGFSVKMHRGNVTAEAMQAVKIERDKPCYLFDACKKRSIVYVHIYTYARIINCRAIYYSPLNFLLCW